MAKLDKLPSSGFHHRQPCYKQGKNPIVEHRACRIGATSPRRQPALTSSRVAKSCHKFLQEEAILCVSYPNSFTIKNLTVNQSIL